MIDGQTILRAKALRGVLWKISEKIGVRLVQFCIQIVLARLLSPDDYGLIALIVVFLNIADVFLTQGFTTALIQKEKPDELDCSSVFYANLIIGVIVYAVLFFVAPLVASFYAEPQLVSLMRVLMIYVLVNSCYAVHVAFVSRSLDFRKSFIANVASVICQGVIGIGLAIAGAGVWALVISRLGGAVAAMASFAFLVKWRPSPCFSPRRLRALFSFSSKMLGANLLNVIYNNSSTIIIGKAYSSKLVGFFQKGQEIPHAFMTAVDGGLSEVLYPTLSKLQNNQARMKSALRRAIRVSVFVVYPFLFWLAAVAEPLITLLLTDKWLKCCIFLQLQCVICLFWPLGARVHALNSLGKSSLTFKVSFVGKSIAILLMLLFSPLGIEAIMMGMIVGSIVDCILVTYYTNRELSYSLRELLVDIAPTLLDSLIMSFIVLAIGLLNIPTIVSLSVQLAAGFIVYIAVAQYLKIDSLSFLINELKRMIRCRT